MSAAIRTPQRGNANNVDDEVAAAAAAASASDPSASPSLSPDAPAQVELASDADGEGAAAAVEPADSFAPVLSKSARRRLARAKGEQYRAEAHFAAIKAAAAAPAVPSQPRFFTPPPASRNNNSSSSHYAAQLSRSAGPLHGGQHSASPLPALQELFPDLSSDLLNSLWLQCNRSFEGVVDYMLAHQTESTEEEKRMQSALTASLAEAASESSSSSASASPSPPARVVGSDNLSQLSGDLFSLVCDFLNLFELSMLAGVSKDARNQTECGAFARVDKLDFARYATSWPDWKMLRMVARFSSTTSLSFRNTRFKSFSQLSSLCFGRRIKHLSLAGCVHLGDHHLHELMGLGEFLESLDLNQVDNLTDEGLEHIATARHNLRLAKLNLSDCLHISSLGVERILERCGALQQLDLKGTNVTRSILQFQNQHSQLSVLNLSTCRKLPADLAITSAFCRLAELSLSSNLSLKNVTLSIVTLTHLNLSNAKHVLTLTLYTPRLKLLNLNGCLVLHAIATVPHQSKVLVTRLESINANLCRSITSLSFHNLLQSAAPTLKNLSCRGCLLLSDANIALLTQERPSSGASVAGASVSGSSLPASSPSLCVLESLDLSGCKAASPGAVVVASRMVTESNERRERQAAERRAGEHGDAAWRRSSAGSRSHSNSKEDDQWSGGLDDDEASESPREPEPLDG